MRSTRYRDLCDVRVLVSTCSVLLLCSAFCAATGKMAPSTGGTGRDQHHPPHHHYHHQHSPKQKSAHYRPLTASQKADQSLQFMLDFYRRAANPDGRPREHRRFGSNTVRLLRPATTTVRAQAAFRDLHYTFSVQYDLRGLAMDRLARASFVHLRSSSPALPWLPCRARVTTPGPGGPSPLPLLSGDPVVLSARERWRETDISGLVAQRKQGSRLALSAQYRCTDPGRGSRAGGPLRRARGVAGVEGRWRRGAVPGLHLNAPALLLFLEEEAKEGAGLRGWAGRSEVPGLAAGGRKEEKKDEEEERGGEGRLGRPSRPSPTRPRRSKNSANSASLKDRENSSSAAELILSASSSSSSSPPPSSSSSSSGSIMSEIPNYKRKSSPVRYQCKLHSYRVSFQELGWDHYIIAPHRYNPHYCKGDCPRVLHYGLSAPNHAVVQTLISELGAGEVPPPSCVPRRYKPMSVLILEESRSVVYREYDDMIAESCTCR